jgi:hypothetical protein
MLRGMHRSMRFLLAVGRMSMSVTCGEPIMVQASVRTCRVSEDCRHLLLVAGSGYVFRFECTPDK